MEFETEVKQGQILLDNIVDSTLQDVTKYPERFKCVLNSQCCLIAVL